MKVGYPDTLNRKEVSPLKVNYLQSGTSVGDLHVVDAVGEEKDPAEQAAKKAAKKGARQERRAARKASGEKTGAGKAIEKVGKGLGKVGKGIGKGISKLFGG